MSVRMKKGLSVVLLLALLLSVMPAASAEGIEELELEPIEIVAVEDEPDVIIVPDPEADSVSPEVPETGPADDNILPPVEIVDDEDDAGKPEPDAGKPEPDTAEPETDAGKPEPDDSVPTMGDEATYASYGGAGDVRLYAELTLGEEFRLALCVQLPADADPAQYCVKTVFEAQMSEQTIDRSLSAEDLEDGLYVIPDIAAARLYQLTAPVEITLFRGTTQLRHEVYDVRTYLRQLAGIDEKYVNFSAAALCCGGAAQRYFEGQSFTRDDVEYEYEVFPDDPADSFLTEAEEPPYPLPEPTRPIRETVYTGSVAGVGNLAARFQTGVDTALRFYFSFPQSPAALTFKSEAGYPIGEAEKQAPGFWYVDLTGIHLTELADDFVVTAAMNGQKMSIIYSPYRYAAQHWTDSNTKLAELCRMLVALGNETAALNTEVEEE